MPEQIFSTIPDNFKKILDENLKIFYIDDTILKIKSYIQVHKFSDDYKYTLELIDYKANNLISPRKLPSNYYNYSELVKALNFMLNHECYLYLE